MLSNVSLFGNSYLPSFLLLSFPPSCWVRADIWVNSLKHTKLVGVMVSEENEEAIVFPELTDAKYAIAFDPLDGERLG